MEVLEKFAIGFRWRGSDGNWNSYYGTTNSLPLEWLRDFAYCKGLDLENLCFDFSVRFLVG